MTAIDKVQYLQIGVQGENIAMNLEFDMTAWAEQYPDATFHILFKPYNETEVAPQASSYDSETKVLTWTVGAGATAIVGVGYTEIRAQDGEGLIKKTRVIPTAVESSVSGVEVNPPAAYADWVTNVLNAGAAIIAMAHGTEISFSIDDDGHLVYSYTDEDEETVTVDLGPVDAYGMAVEAGYPRTREQFVDELANTKTYCDAAEAAAEAAEVAKVYAQTFMGAPRTAATAAAMEDTDKIYVYTGSTGGGLTNGHWYYHNGTAWTDGGAYNSTALTTDTTLLVSGAAADAKVTGDKLNEVKSALTSNADLNASIDSDYPITFDFPIMGKYPNWASNGVLTDNANYSATNYLSVRGLKNFSFDGVTGGVYAVCFYDKNFGFISQGSGYAYKSYTVPATAYFMRMGIKTAEISTFVITKYETYLTETKNNVDIVPFLLEQLENTMPLFKDSGSYGRAEAKYATSPILPSGATILSMDVYCSTAGNLEIGFWKVSNNAYYGAKTFAATQGLNHFIFNTEMDGDSKVVFATPSIVRYVASSAGFDIVSVTISDDTVTAGSSLTSFGMYATVSYLPPVSSTTKNELHVGIGQEYTTINQAVTKAYTIESISNPITIIVHPGIYEEVVNIQGKHYISIVGTNRDDCIIIDKTANYNNAPLRISGQAYVANLTMIATADSYNSTFGTGTGKTAWKTDVMAGKSYPDWLGSIMEYAVHCDDITNGEATVCRFENCKMYSECGPAFGSGMQNNLQIELINCEIISDIDADVVNYAVTTQGHGAVGQGTLLIHGKENGTNMTAVVKDCIIRANVGRVLYLYPVGSNNGAKIAFIDNSFFSDSLGSASEYYRNTFSSSAIDGISHGNNIGSLNKPNLAE